MNMQTPLQIKMKFDKIPTHILSVGSIVLCGLLLRGAISHYPYSGQGKPPMFGDYEAQRHWMEITVNLPIHEWYEMGPNNDLLYWGLDYPPLTAYHSWLMGVAAKFINSSWIALNTSRGMESPEHKHFMRSTVLLADALTYIPAAFLFFLVSYPHLSPPLRSNKISGFLVLVLNPTLILIDHGHFQYNCISLGLFLLAVTFYLRDNDIIGSVCFVSSLCYKQMELYHALPIFFYLLSRCFHAKSNALRWKKLFSQAFIVILTFAVIFYPFLYNGHWMQVLRRLFPVDRGMYEDKVSNIWCSLSVIVKIGNFLPREWVLVLCAATTFLCSAPSLIYLLYRPTKRSLVYSLAISSLAFFLFSYQVHEKSILLATVPVIMLYPRIPHEVELFLYASTLSMWPLLVKDGLAWATVLLLVCVRAILSYGQGRKSPLRWFLLVVQMAVYFLLCTSSLLINPPQRYPDIFDLFISMFSCLQFFAFLFYFYFGLFTSP